MLQAIDTFMMVHCYKVIIIDIKQFKILQNISQI